MDLNTKLYQLDYIINVDKFQKIQNDIAKATGMAVIAIDYKGNPITAHSSCSEFCSAVRQDPELGPLCEKCDSRGGLEAARNLEPYIYLCHIGIVDFAIPIVVEGQYLGALMAGQIRLENTSNNQELERIVSKKYQYDLESNPHLKALYHQLEEVPLEKIEAVAHMMNHLINYIVGEAVLKTSLYEANLKLHEDTTVADQVSTNPLHDVHLYYEDTSKQLSEVNATQGVTKIKKIPTSSLLMPALIYIENHLDEKVYLDDMAYRCNISPSYFSKIFKRETGYNFSSYVVHKKLAWAKTLLETTTEPILNLSLNLGFDDCGYFIKLFKKEYGVTPAVYRNDFSE